VVEFRPDRADELLLLRVKAYLHEPRDQWVQNWPGQVVLCVSQIYWTAHVHAAFDGSGPTLSAFWNSLQVRSSSQLLSLSLSLSLSPKYFKSDVV